LFLSSFIIYFFLFFFFFVEGDEYIRSSAYSDLMGSMQAFNIVGVSFTEFFPMVLVVLVALVMLNLGDKVPFFFPFLFLLFLLFRILIAVADSGLVSGPAVSVFGKF
jgi:hypothetical protein